MRRGFLQLIWRYIPGAKLKLHWPEEENSVAPVTSKFLTVVVLKNHGYWAMPGVEETLASYLFPTLPKWRKLILSSKQYRATSAFV